MFGKEKAQKQPETLGEFIRSILIAILFAVGIQTVAYQTFNIPSGSMKPNLLIGDFIFVSKFAYGYTHYSIPFSPPLFEGRLFGSEPKRGEVVVFRAPHKTNSEDWIKRCIGLPGDKIQMRGGVLFINDQECPLEKLDGDFLDTLYIKYNGDGTEERILDKNGTSIERYMQTLPNGVKHIIIKEKPFGLKKKELKKQYKKKRANGSPSHERAEEADMSKIDCAIKMFKRAISLGFIIDYALMDSWFTCDAFINAVLSVKKQTVHLCCESPKSAVLHRFLFVTKII